MVKGGSGSTNMGTVMSWAIGVASIALLLLIMLILFGNLSGNVGFTTVGTTIQVNNESPAYLNSSNYTFAVTNSSTSGYIIIRAWNLTGSEIVPSGYHQVDGDIMFTNGTDYIALTVGSNNDVNVTYTYVYTIDSVGLANTNNFINNYTQSVLNVGKQLPTVGTIIGVALLLFILIALLVFALRKMRGVGGAGGNFG